MKVDILGVKIDGLTMREALARIEGFLKDEEFHFVVTPNPEIVIFAQKDRKFAEILNHADLAIPDGEGLVWAAKILGKNIKERVSGVDLADEICKMAAEKGFRIGFLGGGPGVADEARECQIRKYPGLKVVFSLGSDPENAIKNIADSLRLTDYRKKNKNAVVGSQRAVDILLVAYGFPKQEYWMAKYGRRSGVKVAIGVGGALDYFAGRLRRAPKFIRILGLEWLWRLILEPWRIKRQKALLKFIWLVFGQVVRSRFKKISSKL